MKITHACLIALVLACPVVLPQTTGPIPDAEIDALRKQFNVPGVSVPVIRNFQIEWARGYGIADVESGAPVTSDTMFQAASISKPVVEDRRFIGGQEGLISSASWSPYAYLRRRSPRRA